MTRENSSAHPYIPNSVPEVRKKMLEEIGVESREEFYEDIPEELMFRDQLEVPEALGSEQELRSHLKEILSRNRSCEENLSFLGGGCWPHYVPAICDEINSRSEFLTAYAGEAYEDHGRFQATFEYASMMGELLDLDVVSVPTYDWAQAASTALRMAARIAERGEILVARSIAPQKMEIITNYCKPDLKIRTIAMDKITGLVDLDDLRSKVSPATAAVYFENPSYLGFLEHRGQQISEIIHGVDGLCVVGVDPSSLGVIAPPPSYGADIVCGELQPLGMHMQYGGGLAGFIASPDEEKFVSEYPLRLFGIASTEKDGEYGFGDVTFDRTSFAQREGGKEFVGTMSALWGITAGVYLALMGPEGMVDLGKTITQRSQYAIKKLSELDGVRTPAFSAAHFKEFVVDFNKTGKTVGEINQKLLDRGIFGGIDLSSQFPQLGQAALFCVTEQHDKKKIDRLTSAVKEVLL